MNDDVARLSEIFNALGGKTSLAIALTIHHAGRPLLWHEVIAACGTKVKCVMTRLTDGGILVGDTEYELPVPIKVKPAIYSLAPDVAAVLTAALEAVSRNKAA